MGTTGVEGGDGYGIGGVGDELEKVLREEAAMETLWAMGEEIMGLEGVGTLEGNGGDLGIVWMTMYLEDESRGESCVGTLGMSEQEVRRIDGIGS